MDGTTAVAVIGLIGVVFNTVWNWIANRKKQEQDNHIRATASAVKSFQEANDELREELKRIAEERDLARREATQARQEAISAAEQVLGVMADALNKNTISNNALADVIRESITASMESRARMQEATTTMIAQLTEIAARQEVLRADARNYADADRVASATIQERLDQVHDSLSQLIVRHDENAQGRVRTILETIETLLSSTPEATAT